jgi:hypothetical protein
MANNLITNISVNGSVNGLTINTSGGSNLAPTGSIVLAESVLVQTGSYQLVATGSINPISIIYIGNSGVTGSINVALSSSTGVTNLGNIGPSNGSINTATLVNWNSTFSGLYAQAITTASYAIFVVSSQ